MNEGRIWTVVKPTVGVPLFLAAVCITSMLVHHAILNNTSWFSAFMQGGAARPAVTAPAP
jgi:light-harvesting protein B-800-850 alpha chain